MPFDVVGLGLCAWDRLCLFERYPDLNQKLEVASNFQCGGGPVPNALVVFSRLGGKAAFIGVSGDNQDDLKIRSELIRYDIDVSNLIVRPGQQSPCAYIWVDGRNGQRTVALDPGNTDPLQEDELPVEVLKETPLLLIDGRSSEICVQAALHCRKGRGQVILDAGSPRPNLDQMLSATDHAVVSSDFVRGTFPNLTVKQALKEIQSMGPQSVVVTQGKQGGIWLEGASEGRYSAFSVPVKDTTGAGDAFHGGYLFALKNGLPMDERCRFASAVAALVCRGLGGRSTAPTYKEVTKMLLDNPCVQSN